jgi:ribosomal protein S18 acetylase RimI-like enzyme
LLAEAGTEPIGLAWGRIEASSPEVANLYQLWIAPEYRRLGTGQMLLETVIAWAREAKARRLALDVTCGDTPAMRLYRRAGFEPVGQPQPLRPGSDLLEQPMLLEL